jgi:hypothetical protein
MSEELARTSIFSKNTKRECSAYLNRRWLPMQRPVGDILFIWETELLLYKLLASEFHTREVLLSNGKTLDAPCLWILLSKSSLENLYLVSFLVPKISTRVSFNPFE